MDTKKIKAYAISILVLLLALSILYLVFLKVKYLFNH